MVIREVVIFTEDTYGVDFFRKLVKRLIEENIIGSIKYDVKRIAGKCYIKFGGDVVTAVDSFDRVIVVVDSEGNDKDLVIKNDVLKCINNHIKNRVKKDVKKEVKSKVGQKLRIVVLDYKIEDWICYGLGIKISSDPVENLKDWFRKNRGYKFKYSKNALHYFVYGERSYPKIDLSLLNGCKTFEDFVSALTDD
jgi:hypothetical protein